MKDRDLFSLAVDAPSDTVARGSAERNSDFDHESGELLESRVRMDRVHVSRKQEVRRRGNNSVNNLYCRRLEVCGWKAAWPTQAVHPPVGLAADRIMRDRYVSAIRLSRSR